MPKDRYHSVVVTPQLPLAYKSGGIGTATAGLIKILQDAGDEITVIYTHPPESDSKAWVRELESQGIEVIVAHDYMKGKLELPGVMHFMLASKIAHDNIPETADVVYFADWQASGYVHAQARQVENRKTPVMVTILHGNSQWHREGMHLWPANYWEGGLYFCERYAAEHSDFTVAPSQYSFNWCEKNRWKLQPKERQAVLGYPFFPEARKTPAASLQAGQSFKKLIHFGRVETRKGIDLFIEAIISLADSDEIKPVEEIILLGLEGPHIYGSVDAIEDLIAEHLPEVKFTHHKDYDTYEAQDFLAQNAEDSLVIVASRAETLGFTAIEASLIPNLNMICTGNTAIPEALGDSLPDMYFEPYVKPLAKTLKEWLKIGPRPDYTLPKYDWEARNQLWRDFHKQVCDYVDQRLTPERVDVMQLSEEEVSHLVDVCIPYYNLGKYLPQLLDSLAKQTMTGFNVHVVNDGSTDEFSQRVWQDVVEKYKNQPRWHFHEQDNQGVCVARNAAAAFGEAKYLIFMDSDNVAKPYMVQRFLEGILWSEVDLLTCYMYQYEGESSPLEYPDLLVPTFLYTPYGNAPWLNILENPFGDMNCIMKRSVFQAVGGFTLDMPKQINQEDRELITRISIEGYNLDVIPEYLFWYRHRDDSRLRTTSIFENEARVLRIYQEKLAQFGLADMIPLIIGLKYTSEAYQPSQSLHGPATYEKINMHIADPADFVARGVPWGAAIKGMIRKITQNLPFKG